jgi:hypothetical protein
VLLQDDDVDARASHQEAEHHTGGPAADDQELGPDALAHGNQSIPVARHREKENEAGAPAIGFTREFG